MSDFETGATTAAANNLVLSVLNDGATYETRKHCGFAELQGTTHGSHSFIGLVRNEAEKQRANGSKFPAASIGEAARLVRAQTITHCLEIIRDEWDGGRISVCGRKWRDNVNGNTYFSARLVIPTTVGARWVSIPFQYGYGDQWQWEAIKVLRKIGFFADKPERVTPRYELPVDFIFEGLHLKKNMYSGVSI